MATSIIKSAQELQTCGGARDDNQSEACVGRSPKVLSCHKPHNNPRNPQLPHTWKVQLQLQMRVKYNLDRILTWPECQKHILDGQFNLTFHKPSPIAPRLSATNISLGSNVLVCASRNGSNTAHTGATIKNLYFKWHLPSVLSNIWNHHIMAVFSQVACTTFQCQNKRYRKEQIADTKGRDRMYSILVP